MAQTPQRVEQLKDAIDRGEGADKVAAFDPAAVPLGADDEAAGTPPPPAAVRQAGAAESRRAAGRPDALRSSAATHYPSQGGVTAGWARWAVVAIVAATVAVGLWLLA